MATASTATAPNAGTRVGAVTVAAGRFGEASYKWNVPNSSDVNSVPSAASLRPRANAVAAAEAGRVVAVSD